ncbi:hypothetical protein TNCV_1404381 [Trichonephila clavipes]|nr:hypothetical protein TNCV_1404381 [Trichonephila clavipes]
MIVYLLLPSFVQCLPSHFYKENLFPNTPQTKLTPLTVCYRKRLIVSAIIPDVSVEFILSSPDGQPSKSRTSPKTRRIHPLTKPGRTLPLKTALTKHSGAFHSEIKVFFASHGTVIKRLERVPLNGSYGMEYGERHAQKDEYHFHWKWVAHEVCDAPILLF